MIKPKRRLYLRIIIGKIYYGFYKWVYWNFSKTKFPKLFNDTPLEFLVISHSSPLIRKLAGLDLDLQKNKVVNLKLAIKNLNGLILRPGETFSYWKEIGMTTRIKGYKPGLILQDGKLGVGIGGGLCQLSNLIYWMTLHTPLAVKERWRHSYDVFPDVSRTLPFGSGATCAYPYIDLQIVNNTQHSFQLKLSVTSEMLIGEWRSDKEIENKYEVFESDHKFMSEWWGGYSRNNVLKRKIKFKDSNVLIREEVIAKNSARVMYNPFLKKGQ